MEKEKLCLRMYERGRRCVFDGRKKIRRGETVMRLNKSKESSVIAEAREGKKTKRRRVWKVWISNYRELRRGFDSTGLKRTLGGM